MHLYRHKKKKNTPISLKYEKGVATGKINSSDDIILSPTTHRLSLKFFFQALKVTEAPYPSTFNSGIWHAEDRNFTA